ncbi:hypothetical protein D3C79_993930 [compost metagenome]
MYHQPVSNDRYISTFTYYVSFSKFNSVFTFWHFSTECMVKVQMLHEEYRVIVADRRDKKSLSIIWV